MKKQETIFDYFGQIFMVYGFSILCVNVFCNLFGETAKGVSSLFALGAEGLSCATMWQYLLMAVVIITLKFLFFTDLVIKRMSMLWRMICMLVLIFATVVAFVLGFDWFPVTDWKPWLLFVLCFVFSAGISIVIFTVKEKMENEKLEKALNHLKKEQEEES